MCTIIWEEDQHRLRLTGTCGEGDRERVAEALANVADESPVLIIDLTGVESLAPAVAEVIVAACGRSDRCRVNVLRRHRSDVDRVLSELEG